MVASLLNIRRVCIGPWREGFLAKPGRTGIDAAVHPATPATDGAMFHPPCALITFAASFAGAGRIGEHRGGAERGCLGDDLLAGVEATHVPPLAARDLPPGAVGLKTAAKGKITITLVTTLPTNPEPACADSGEVVFFDVQSQRRAGIAKLKPLIDNAIERQPPLGKNQFGLPRLARGEQSGGFQRDANAAGESGERNPQGEHTQVEMHAGAAEIDLRDRLVRRNRAVRPDRSLGAPYGPQHSAACRRTKERSGTQVTAVGKTVQGVPVAAPRFDDDRNGQVAGADVWCALQCGQAIRSASPTSIRIEAVRFVVVGFGVSFRAGHLNRQARFCPFLPKLKLGGFQRGRFL
jgi:hypothetical protein